jgi:hypothetical protein
MNTNFVDEKIMFTCYVKDLGYMVGNQEYTEDESKAKLYKSEKSVVSIFYMFRNYNSKQAQEIIKDNFVFAYYKVKTHVDKID